MPQGRHVLRGVTRNTQRSVFAHLVCIHISSRILFLALYPMLSPCCVVLDQNHPVLQHQPVFPVAMLVQFS